MRLSVHEEDRIWFRIPFTIYFLGWAGGKYGGFCLWRKDWDPKQSDYFWDIV